MLNFLKNNNKNIAELIMSDMKKDLHIHTCYSDGIFTPEEVVDRWKAEGYKLIAITDHDGMDGSIIGMDYARGSGIMFISGIEFDSEDALGRDMHILGYGFDYNCPELRANLFEILRRRAIRNDSMMKALNEMGYEITLDDIGKVNEGRYVGKPTFARIMSSKGYISNPQEAFGTVFREPSIRNISKKTFSSESVINLIHTAGGLAFFAHPMEQRHLDESFEEFKPRMYQILDRMTEYGIDGIECYHPSASEEQAELLREYAEQRGLLISEGSDFHSDVSRRDFSRYHRP
ncbi:MAG: PHP domain-containing protein [Mogibacterium sp.]|nr:PHP domain-containing protein [Mogibacterium sp.]